MKSFFNRLGKADHISLPHSLTLPPTFKRQSGLEKSVYGLFQVRMENDLLHVTSPELILSGRAGAGPLYGFYTVTPHKADHPSVVDSI